MLAADNRAQLPIASESRLEAISKKIQQGFLTKLDGRPSQDHPLQSATIT
jgi:hypothetical protein